MILRNLKPFILKYADQYPILAIVGPRQSGKTTLAKQCFPGYKYINFESLDNRMRAEDDPRGFLEDTGPLVILDEIQRVPTLFTYLQEYVDQTGQPAQYVLTGSHQFLLMEKISQSLAGRIITFKLFPFTINEIYSQLPDKTISGILLPKESAKVKPERALPELLLTGMYPRIHDQRLEPRKWIENYLETYIERDVRLLINISNIRLFENFLKITATHSGQLINFAAIANSVGISQPTVKKWLSVLEASGIIFILSPYYKNYNKRIVKTPKLFFIDSALLCFLLSIKTTDELKASPLYGNIFETFIISEFYKRIYHICEKPPLYFWRDKTANEIDLLIENGLELIPIEIKLTRTFSDSFYTPLSRWMNLDGNPSKRGYILYTGNECIGKAKPISVYPWYVF